MTFGLPRTGWRLYFCPKVAIAHPYIDGGARRGLADAGDDVARVPLQDHRIATVESGQRAERAQSGQRARKQTAG